MYKVVAIFDGEVKEEVFITKASADEFAFRLMEIDMSTCPMVVGVMEA